MYKIYKLIYEENVVYVGRTIRNLKDRKRNGYKRNPELQKIYKNCDIVLIEETDDKSRELYWINHYKSDKLLNILKGSTISKSQLCKNWRERNKEKLTDYNKKYRMENPRKEYQKEYQKEYREKNKETLKEYFREYHINKRKKI